LASARTDFLTGLANRAGFEAELEEHIGRARPDAHELVLIYIDLNGFKSINDGMGHSAGDDVLKTIASRLRESFATSNFIARMGGDEFIVLFEIDRLGVARMLADLRDTVERVFKPCPVDGLVADVGAAIGVAFLREDDSAASFTKRADSYMYLAKATGNRIAVVALGELAGEVPAPVSRTKTVSKRDRPV
jgi:diguanylate cyclase (GGDEF)-like protein